MAQDLQITKEKIMFYIEEKHGIPKHILKSRKRNNLICQARFEYIYLCRALIPKTSYCDIGRVLNRDHSTIIHGLQTFKNEHEIKIKDDQYINICIAQILGLQDIDITEPVETVNIELTKKIIDFLGENKEKKIIDILEKELYKIESNTKIGVAA